MKKPDGGALILWLAAILLLPIHLHPAEAAAKLTFEEHIRPILKANCFDCHGEGGTAKGGLDLRLRRLMMAGGESGPAIVPGAVEKSLLIEKVRSGEMPKREKKLTSAEIESLERWVADGAPTLRAEPESIGSGHYITPEERQFWSFQPIRRPAIPRPRAVHAQARTAIDAFLLEKLQAQQLTLSPEANRVTLIRRATFDLWGLPPEPADVERFLADRAPDAYERLVDRLLASPRYGERWARHWLDAAGYADSDGYTDADSIRPYAYKYRDYVVRAFNADKPFDEFIQEQLAGDEMIQPPYPNLPAAQQEKLVATGFLRMGPDGTASGGIDHDVARNQVVADTLKIVTTSLLGLSVGCAQCHDHRYDPISQEDYYRIRAVLEPAYDWKKWRNPNQRLISLYTDADRARAAEVEKEAAELTGEKNVKQAKHIEEALEKHLEKFDEALREPLRTAFRTTADKRTEEQSKLLKDHPSVNITPGVLYQYNQKAADELKAMDAKIAEIRGRKPVEDFIQALTEEPGHVPATHLFHRGDPKQPRAEVQPGMLSVLAGPSSEIRFPGKDPERPTTGRRLAFARWLTGPENPLTARVLVNRIWMHHFGRGLTGTPGDLGATGERPSHPELLDWLASVFRSPIGAEDAFAMGWSLKRLHRLILTSAAYRQSSGRSEEAERIDPENRLYWRKPLQRLDAEALRDAVLAVSGMLNTKMHGSPVPVREDLLGQVVVGVDRKEGDNKMPVEVAMGAEEFRRSVYVQVRRSQPLAFLNAFDAPVMEVNCERRASSTVAPQALMLMNSDFAVRQAERFAERLVREAGEDRAAQVHLAWQLAFSRGATGSELNEALAFLDHQAEHLKAHPIPVPEPKDKKEKEKQTIPTSMEPHQQALANLCQTLLSANEFLYVD